MKESEIKDEISGELYPDPLSFDISKFKRTSIYETTTISQQDIIRSDLLSYRKYGNSEFDDILLLLNVIGHVCLLDPGEEIEIPQLSDIENFYRENLSNEI